MIPRKNTDIEPANKVLNSQTSTPNKAYGKLKDLPNAIWALLTNPTYMMINFGGGANNYCDVDSDCFEWVERIFFYQTVILVFVSVV